MTEVTGCDNSEQWPEVVVVHGVVSVVLRGSVNVGIIVLAGGTGCSEEMHN